MTVTKKDQISEIQSFFFNRMSVRYKKLFEAAVYDLWHGPLSRRDALDRFRVRWPGYPKAIDMLSEWWHENGSDVWYDTQSGYVSDQEPEWAHEVEDPDTGEIAWDGDDPEDWVYYDRNKAGRAVFGRLISDGGMSL
jgi:hypothetical protein